MKRAPVCSLFLFSLRFNGNFPGEPGLAGVYWSKGWWRWWWQLDYWSYKSCKAPVKSTPPTNQHPVFYRPDALPVAQPTVSKHWREKYHIPCTCLPLNSPGVFQLCLWSLIAPGYLGEVCHAMPLISPLMPVPWYASDVSLTEAHPEFQFPPLPLPSSLAASG